MKKKEKIACGLVLILVVFFYLLVPVFIYPDSTIYYKTATILLGLDEFSSWDIVRGPTMALVQFPFLLIFGNNEFSLRLCTCLFYIIMLLLAFKFVFKNENKKLCLALFIVLFLLNPILYGYYHALLTEFVATTLSVLVIYVSCWFLDSQYDRKHFLLMISFYCFIFVFMWFLKQPYFTIALFPCFVVSILKIKNKKDILKSSLVLIVLDLCQVFRHNFWKDIILPYLNLFQFLYL